MTQKYQDKYADRLKKSAARALDDLPESEKLVATQSRAQLYQWLIGVDECFRDPGKAIDDRHGDTAANALMTGLEALLADSKDGAAAQAMLTAFQTMSDEGQLNLLRHVVTVTIREHATASGLVSRHHGASMSFWEPTGFSVDTAVRTVFAKVGSKEGQPIGFEDDSHYVGTPESKTLWARDFGMSFILPYRSAFEVSREVDLLNRAVPTGVFTKNQLEQIDEILGWFESDIAEYKGAATEAKPKVIEKIGDTIKLAGIRIPQFERLLEDQLAAHPELGDGFVNADPVQFLLAASEWFRMKRDEAATAVEVERTTLLVRDQRAPLLSAVKAKLAACVPPKGSDPDLETSKRALVEACIAFPQLRGVVDAAPDLLGQLEVALVELQKLTT